MKRLSTILTLLAVSMLGLWSCGDDKTEDKIAVQSVTVQPTEATLEVGQALTLEVAILPEKATVDRILYSSDNTQVATVSAEGVIDAIAAGSATITVKAGNKTAVCRVTVNEKTVAVESVTLDKTEASLQIGETITLTAAVLPENATDKTVAWSSSDTSVATVDNDGKVTAIKAGNAKIIASVGDIKAECAVTVNEATVEVESVVISEKEVNLTVGENIRLTATVMPENATDKTVTWSSSNESVATVDATGKVTAIAAGQAVITASASDKSATCTVTVEKPADLIEIPDANFKKYLVENFDTDKDGGISVQEAAAITAISCPNKGIISLAGIEYFTALQSLDCSDNDIAEIDLSKNSALKTLNCSANSLTSITPADCPELTSLNCANNQIAGIYIGGNKALTDFNCANNKLSIIYLVENSGLKTLNCASNKISALNLGSNTGLISLNCSGNNISSLDVSEISGLTELDCSGNGSLAALSANNLASLTKLDCSNCNLSTLMVNGNSALTYLDFTSNKVAGIWLGLNKNLENLYCSGNKMTFLNLADNTALSLVICGKQASALTLKLPAELKSKWDTWKNIPNNAGVTLE